MNTYKLSTSGDMRFHIGTVHAIAFHLAQENLPYLISEDSVKHGGGRTHFTLETELTEEQLKEKLYGTRFSYDG
ncbi:MAG: hypothetical protein CO092_00110 [Candidatus Aenigmarchaeota archaeon CG_4_9_14_3_um_filter_37_18]|nr:MAG: hypothetical protein COW21_01670 [Candidatus Aenigmarchaeota archaeon CG15_BIG_FIL_POST_REV_8_21_14_020_37_27]PIY35214.1 MAG: hypothetical protein COZ04_04245 [Candidatus Aenigmarchaeota archaeon CG_4_10_14_3_um_filter_37_21]PJB76136.1 MAG: hypothetical protein CO092_00110 [Candidatus Aenigmarchaeota archaeon CG_4_9_14_3_um_filter_37_18]